MAFTVKLILLLLFSKIIIIFQMLNIILVLFSRELLKIRHTKIHFNVNKHYLEILNFFETFIFI